MKSLRQTLRSLARHLGLETAVQEAQVLSRWRDVPGTRGSRAVRFRDGVLVVLYRYPFERDRWEEQSEHFRTTLNTLLGGEVVREIRWHLMRRTAR